MIKTLQKIIRQDKEKFSIPRGVQQVIPVNCLWTDGIFRVGGKFSKSYRFDDINYAVASREDQETMFLSLPYILSTGTMIACP